MAVYVIPRRNVYGGVLGNLGNGLMNYVFGGMMARDAQARQARRSRGLWDDMSRTMKAQPGLPQPEAPRPQYSEDVQNIANAATRGMPTATDNQGWKGLWDSTVGLGKEYKPGREELLSVFGRHGVTPQEAELAMNFYKNQFETADKLGYQDNVASRVGGLDYDVRGNAPSAVRSAAIAGAYGIDMAPVYERTAPQFSFSSADLGDKLGYFVQDPLTGAYDYRTYGYDLNPTKKYEADAKTRQTQIKAAADRDVANTNLRGDIITSRGGGGQGGNKSVTPSVYNFIDTKIGDIVQTVSSQEEYNDRINSLIASYPQAREYIIQAATSPKYMFDNKVVNRPEDNQYAGGFSEGAELGTITPGQTGSQPQGQISPQMITAYRQRFPQYQNMTDAQIAERLVQMQQM